MYWQSGSEFGTSGRPDGMNFHPVPSQFPPIPSRSFGMRKRASSRPVDSTNSTVLYFMFHVYLDILHLLQRSLGGWCWSRCDVYWDSCFHYLKAEVLGCGEVGTGIPSSAAVLRWQGFWVTGLLYHFFIVHNCHRPLHVPKSLVIMFKREAGYCGEARVFDQWAKGHSASSISR
jgi:hypothetical protein